MRIAWASPMNPESAIGRFSKLVLPLLREHADVDVWEPPGATSKAPTHLLPSRRWAADALSPYDAVFYNLGNHSAHHGAIWRASQGFPGIVLAHDVNVHALVRGTPHEHGSPGYLELLERAYGPAARQHATAALRGERTDVPWSLEHSGRYPLIGAVVAGARTVVVHSAFAEALARAEFVGNVVVAPLPFARLPEPTEPVTRTALGLPEDRLVLLAVGHVLGNRHLDRVIDALGLEEQLRERCTLVAAGDVDDEVREALLAQAQRTGVDMRVLGRVDDPLLQALLNTADVSLNLRHPHTESASGTLLEALLHALPVVIMRSGPHAEVPAEAAVVVGTSVSARDLATALLPLLDPQVRAEAGRHGRAHAERVHGVPRYAARMLDLARHPGSTAPLTGVLRAVAKSAHEMALPVDGPFGASLAQTVLDVLGRPGDTADAPVLRR